ncbi:MAG: lipopolysaccharide heptosyltransferase II [Candidatus Eisenbacteria bacterium]|nr:lipopolysaccharide heptosyltransferase II [Candidatus Eisenbacteria bacterium]
MIRLSSLGDVVLATSVPAVLKSEFPGARVAFLTKDAFAEVLGNNPNIDQTIPLTASESSFSGLFRIARRLKVERFDLVIDLQANPRTILLCALISPRRCVRADRDSLVRHGAVRFKSLLPRRGRHVVQRYLAPVQKLLGPVPALKPQMFVAEGEKESARQFLRCVQGPSARSADGPTVAICPGARWKTKVWGAGSMSLLAKALVRAGYGVLVLGGEADEAILREMKSLCENEKAVRFHTGGLRTIAALMSQCDCVVSNDSGLMHMAYAVGTPVVAIFGSTTPEFGFYPPDSRSTVISKSFQCKPCDVHGKNECPKGDFRCMNSVEVSEVMDVVDATLKRASGRGERTPRGVVSREARSLRIESPRFVLGEGEPAPSGNAWGGGGVPSQGSIVVRVPNWVGDVVMAYPALGALRNCTRGLRIVAVAHERVASLLESAPFMDEVLVIKGKGVVGPVRTARALRAGRFALGIVMPDSFSSAFLFRLGGVKRIVGFRGEMRNAFLRTGVSKKNWCHLSEQYAQLLPRGCEIDRKVGLQVSHDGVSRARKILEEAGVWENTKLAIVAPGASYGETKRWPEERYTDLVRLLVEKAQFQVILVGNLADEELCARIARKAGRSTVNLSGQTTLPDLAAIASIASVFVGNDSGAAHVAAASGCPVVVVVGSSDPSWTAPNGDIVDVIYERVSCSPCFLKKCPYDLRCLSQIDAERVYRAAIGASRERRSDRYGGNS